MTPLLATRDALLTALRDARGDSANWRDRSTAEIVDALLASGVVRDPATLAETPDFLYRVTNRAIPLHPTGRVTVTETQAVLRALAAALTEGPVERPKWSDLFGIAPDYTDGKPVDVWLEEQRGEA